MIFSFAFANDSDREKFEVVFKKYRRLMLYKAHDILRDPQLAEDAVSEAFIRIFKNMDKIGDPSDRRSAAFVVTITKNVALTMVKKENRGASADIEEIDPADTFDLESHVLQGLQTETVYALLECLSEELRSVILLKYAYDLPHRKIAKLLTTTENNVTVRLHRAKKKLAVLLREGGHLDE